MPLRAMRFIRPPIFFAAFLAFGLPQLPAASQADHYLLNATSGVVELTDLRAAEHTVYYKLDPGYSFVFNGIFTRLQVRMPAGQTLTYTDRQLRKLHGGKIPNNGHWLLDQRGLRLVSATDYLAAYQRLHKRRP